MRILVFHGYLLEGTGSNVYNARLAEALARLGHEVHLLSQDRHADEEDLSHAARDVAQVLERRGACFFADLVGGSKRLPSEVDADAVKATYRNGILTVTLPKAPAAKVRSIAQTLIA